MRFFVQMKGYGRVDSKGRAAVVVEQSTRKVIATADAPLALVVAILETWRPSWDYSSKEACEKDIARLRQFADGLEVSEPALRADSHSPIDPSDCS